MIFEIFFGLVWVGFDLHQILLPAEVCLFMALGPLGDPSGEVLPAIGL